LKILFLNNFNYLRGGSEKVLFDEVEMLNLSGHETAIYSRANKLNIATEYDKYFPPEIDTERFSLSLNTLGTVKKLIYSSDARQCLERLLKKFKPDIVHAHNIYGRLSLSVLDVLKKENIPVVMTLHDYKFLCPSYLMLNHGEICERCKGRRYINAFVTKCHKNSYTASAVYAFESWFNHRFRKYDSVKIFISPSRFLQTKVLESGLKPDRITFLPNQINAKQIAVNESAGSYLLYFGRLSREKGVDTLLNAWSGLDTDLSLIIVGDGPERTRLEDMAKEKNSNVTFKGYLSGQTLQDLIAGARGVVMPSEWYENAPISLLEACAHGKPVIGARIGGIPEMIRDGETGLLFESGNIIDLQNKINQFIGMNSKDIVAMGKAARKKIEIENSPEAHFDGLLKIYHRAMEQ
jgi:glycosyltransferase involved in cell wall biosynthesis